MNEYHLTLAGLGVTLCTPHEITISENLRPFLCAPHQKADCIIALQSCERMPAFSDQGVWHGYEYYDHSADAVRVFHCDAPKGPAFAVTELLHDGNIQLRVLPEYLSYFAGSIGIFNRIGLETLLLQHEGLLLHASLVKYKGVAIAFSAPSGVGKSTHADLWQTHLGAEILNGDRAALRKGEDGWRAYGSPHAGTSRIFKNDHAPLRAIVFLQQAKENRLRRLSAAEAFPKLYPELSIHHWEKAFVEKAMDLALELLAQTPAYLLECLPEESAAVLVKKGLSL